MRIEVLVGNSEEPLIYPLGKPKLTLGSAETCDIIIDAPNISRKHVQIVSEGDSYFVIDQGSTNGTFINEERLVPGRRTEFTSFFPVRLGDSVLITLLSDEEASTEEDKIAFPEVDLKGKEKEVLKGDTDASTKMISLRDLQKAKTSDLVSRRQKIVKKKVAPPEKSKSAPKSKRAQEKSRMRKIQFLVVLLLGGAAYVNFFVIEKSEETVAKVGEEIPIPNRPEKKAVAEQAPPPSKLVPESELPSREKVENLLIDIKCALDTEKYFCGTIKGAVDGQWGAIQVGTMMYVLVDGESYYEEAKRLLPLPMSESPDGKHTPEESARYETQIRQLTAALFFLRAVPETVDYELIKDFKLTFGLFGKTVEGNQKLNFAITVLPQSMKEFRRIFEETHLTNVSKIGASAIEFTKELYRVY